MLFELMLLLIIGMIFIILGWLIWKKEKINLIHSYQYDKVAESDEKAYTALMGKDAVIIGAGIILTGVINFFLIQDWDLLYLKFVLCLAWVL